jgi:hypothetical protein
MRYQVEAKRPGDGSNYELVGFTNGVSVDVKPTYDGLWGFRVKAIDIFSNSSIYLEKGTSYLSINSRVPPDVTNFNITLLGETSNLTWDSVTAVNLSHYEIRYSTISTGATWNTSQILFLKIPKDAANISTVTRVGSYLIKAVTIPTETFPNGVYSQNATIISNEILISQGFNFVLDIVEDPDFLGAKTNVQVINDSLELTDGGELIFAGAGGQVTTTSGEWIITSRSGVASSGVYYFDNTVDLGFSYTSRLTATVDVGGNNLANSVDDWLNVDEIANVDGADEGQWGILLQVRYTNDDPGGTPVWTEWSDFNVGDYNARAFEFRLFLYSYSPNVTPSVHGLLVTVDMPDSLRSGNDLSATAGGITVNYSTPFYGESPAIAIAAQNLQQGDYHVISNKTASSFDIEFFDFADISVTRTFDYVARGYGFVT